ncbi:unnamed protein product, partial [Allacma fusca]
MKDYQVEIASHAQDPNIHMSHIGACDTGPICLSSGRIEYATSSVRGRNLRDKGTFSTTMLSTARYICIVHV